MNESNNYDPTSVPEPSANNTPSLNNTVPAPEVAPAPEPATIDPTAPAVEIPAEDMSAPAVSIPEVDLSAPAVDVPVVPETPVVNQVPTNQTVNQLQQTPTNQNPNPNVGNNINNIEAYQAGIHRNEIKNDLLLLSFIGKNCEKITTRSFNFAGFFFGTLYLLYRKMFGYSMLCFLISVLIVNFLNVPYFALAFNVLIGLFVNKLYIKHAVKKILKIKMDNTGKEMSELQLICAKKGGTSFGMVILGLIAQILVAFIILLIMMLVGIGGFLKQYLNLSDYNFNGIKINNGTVNNTYVPKTFEGDRITIKNIKLAGYSCQFNECVVSIYEDNIQKEYKLETDKRDALIKISDYANYITVDVETVESGGVNYIVDAKIYNKTTNEDLGDVKTEEDLRNKLGFPTLGTHTEVLTLKEIGDEVYVASSEGNYVYIRLLFVNEKGIQIEMNYEKPTSKVTLEKNKKYEVEYKVEKGTFDYSYGLISIKQK